MKYLYHKHFSTKPRKKNHTKCLAVHIPHYAAVYLAKTAKKNKMTVSEIARHVIDQGIRHAKFMH